MSCFGAETIFDLQLQFFDQLLLPFNFAPLSQNQTSKRYARDQENQPEFRFHV